MYCLVPEKPLRLVYGTFYLAIGDTFYESIIFRFNKKPFYCRQDTKAHAFVAKQIRFQVFSCQANINM